MSSYIPQHPAIYPLGVIRSSVLLPVKDRLNRCTSNATNANASQKAALPAECHEGFGNHQEPNFSWKPVEPVYRVGEGDRRHDEELKEAPEVISSPAETWIKTEEEEPRPRTQLSSGELPEFEISESARIYVRNILDRFPQADLKLAQRLGEANWQRHGRVRTGNHISKVELEIAGTNSVFHGSSLFHDSGLGGSSMPSASSYTPSVASFVSKVGDDDTEHFRVPRMPSEVSEGRPFKFICGQILAHVKNRVDWKLHVFADIQPYICVVSVCTDALCTFRSRKEFAEHERKCHLPRLENPFNYNDYLKSEYPDNVSQHTARSAGTTRRGGFSCPLCRKVLGSSTRAYISHLARHMEGIALATLPPDPEDKSDEESGEGSYSSDQLDQRQQEANAKFTPSKLMPRSTLPVTKEMSSEKFVPQNFDNKNQTENSYSPFMTSAGVAYHPLFNSPSGPIYPLHGQGPLEDVPSYQLADDVKISVTSAYGKDIDNLYHNAVPQADGLYHCPWERDPTPNCQHRPEKLKCNFDKLVDSHLKPYMCTIGGCEQLRFSSTAALLRHEREAHAIHGPGDTPFLCYYEGCERGLPGNGFPRQWNLWDHMMRVHNGLGHPKSRSSRSRSASPSMPVYTS